MSSNDIYTSGAKETDLNAGEMSSSVQDRTAPPVSGAAPQEQDSPASATPPTQSAQTIEPAARPGSSSPDVPRTPKGPVRTDTTTALAQALSPPTTPPPVPSSPAQVTRTYSTAIGPSSEQIESLTKAEDQSGPSLQLTLLLTNGARHPFVLDPKYLARRNVDVQGSDPFNLSVYKLKELILREWRDEWEQKPSSPSYIRLISFGKLLEDKTTLKDLKFNRDQRNVIHMTIKPQDFIDEDDGKGAKAAYSSGRVGEEGRSPGCRCVIM